MAKVTLDTIISDVLKMDRTTAPIFIQYGMHCLGCPVASAESIKEASAVHGIDAEKLVEELNKHLDAKNA
jgi:hybrid cluster-associated redox disulfide protein